ncbi:MAG: DUF2807 domain-containing protein [Bacteroidia bacterium]|nr:DUF2807 domain-containing protein [Bacteroidia bacterium]
MKKLLLLVAVACLFAAPTLAQEIEKELRTFDKIVASPRINVVLKQGDQESIRLVYSSVSREKINIEVKNKTLRIYLEDARINEPTKRISGDGYNERRSIYADANVTAYVTYKEIKQLEIRGNQELYCEDAITSKVFVLRAYGENEITLAAVKAEYFKASLYGENELTVKGGKAMDQKYRLFGENRIDTRALKSYSTITSIYGESKLKVNTSDHLRVTAFGEPQITYDGDASVSKGLVFGHARITKSK